MKHQSLNLYLQLQRNLTPQDQRRLQVIARQARHFGLHPYLVGGIVRDLCLGIRGGRDLDVTLTGGKIEPLAQFLAKEWHCPLLSHPQFLTFTLHFKDGGHLDLITARQEQYPEPAALPQVQYGDLRSDLFRRDFSVNSLAMSLAKENCGELVDLTHGWMDLKNKQIRVLHERSFRDDPTRIFRAARFTSRLNFVLEAATRAQLNAALREKLVAKLSKDRLRIELEKILLEKKPRAALHQLLRWKVWEQAGLAQIYHGALLDAAALNALKDKNIILPARLCLLLQDQDEVEAQRFLQTYHFSNTLADPAMDFARLLKDLKSAREIVELPQRELVPPLALALRLFFKRQKNARLKKRWADYERWRKLRLRINGETLQKLGYAPGPKFKQILRAAAAEKFKGGLRTQKQEIRFVFDNFRRD